MMRFSSVNWRLGRPRSLFSQCQRLLFAVFQIVLPSVGASADDITPLASFEKPDAEPFFVNSPVNAISFSADGERIAVSGGNGKDPPNGEVRLLDAADMSEVRFLPVGRAHALSFSNNGRYLALGGSHFSAIWRIEDGLLDLLDRNPLNKDFIFQASGDLGVRYICDDSRLLLFDRSNPWMNVWSLGDRRMKVCPRINDPELEAIQAVDVSPDEAFVAVGCSLGAAGVFRLEPGGVGELQWRRRGKFLKGAFFQPSVRDIKFSPDGERLAILIYDGFRLSLEIWTRLHADNAPVDWRLESTLVGGDDVNQVAFRGHRFAFSPDGEFIAVCGSEESGVSVFHVGMRRLIMRLQYTAMSYFPEDPDLSSELERNADESNSLAALMHIPLVREVAFSPDGKILLTGYESGEVALWQFQKKLAEIDGN